MDMIMNLESWLIAAEVIYQKLWKLVSMTYKLKFLPAAQKEWSKLASPIQKQFKKS